MSQRTQLVLWSMMATQMAAWAWNQFAGGQLNSHQYLLFCLMFMVGQTGAAIECLKKKATGTMVVQVFFFVFSLVGVLARLHQMHWRW
jgi:hypothetical protein